MTNRKNNSVLFLTTLGVYLGLMLVGGAAPQVFAHGALTRNFDLQDEIEISDDLDNKPDGVGDLHPTTLVNFVNELDSLAQSGKFNWQENRSLSIEDLGFSESNNSPSYLGFGKHDPLVDRALVRVGRFLALEKNKAKLGDFHSGWPQTINLDVTLNGDTFSISAGIQFKDEASALAFLDLINSSLAETISSPKGKGQKLIAENTRSKVEGEKVIIITNLPRADLDPLLTSRAK